MESFCSADRERGLTALHGLLKDVTALYSYDADQEHCVYASALAMSPTGERLMLGCVQSCCKRSSANGARGYFRVKRTPGQSARASECSWLHLEDVQ